jgi:hypothetical protein
MGISAGHPYFGFIWRSNVMYPTKGRLGDGMPTSEFLLS